MWCRFGERFGGNRTHPFLRLPLPELLSPSLLFSFSLACHWPGRTSRPNHSDPSFKPAGCRLFPPAIAIARRRWNQVFLSIKSLRRDGNSVGSLFHTIVNNLDSPSGSFSQIFPHLVSSRAISTRGQTGREVRQVSKAIPFVAKDETERFRRPLPLSCIVEAGYSRGAFAATHLWTGERQSYEFSSSSWKNIIRPRFRAGLKNAAKD